MANTIYNCNLSTVNLVDDQASSKDQRFRPCRNLKIMIPVFLGLTLLSVFTIVHFARPNSPLIYGTKRSTSCGLIKGVAEKNAFVFKGIPHARPPVHNLRWRRTEPLDKPEDRWQGTRWAVNSSEVCWQRTQDGVTGSEDCLYLDVYTPKFKKDEQRTSVVVLIGAETLSGPSPGILKPSGELAQELGVVFVRPNFRLDIFGFLAVKPLTLEAGTSGNYGLHDIVAALKWVQLNIENFGGDKDRVTVWGHRAGGTLVMALLGAKQAKGLFSKVWISSASAIYPTEEPAEYEKINALFFDKIQCYDTPCLRSQEADEVMAAVPREWLEPNDGLPTALEINEHTALGHAWLVNDNDLISGDIADCLNQTNLPFKIMLGTTSQSGSLAPLKYNTTDEDPLNIVEHTKGTPFALSKASESLAWFYTISIFRKYNTTLKALHTMISDVRVVCPLWYYALVNDEIPFYVSTFPRGHAADVDSDAAAILGYFEEDTVEKRRHRAAMRQLFKEFVHNGRVKDLTVESKKRVLIVDQSVEFQKEYDHCGAWLSQKFDFARID